MFNNVLVLVITAIIVTAAIMSIGFIVLQRRKENPDEKFAENFINSWEKIRPILTELFVDGVTLYDASQGTYDNLEEYAVNWLLYEIDTADFLLPEEKALFTRDRITTLIRPKLQEWYKQEIKQ